MKQKCPKPRGASRFVACELDARRLTCLEAWKLTRGWISRARMRMQHAPLRLMPHGMAPPFYPMMQPFAAAFGGWTQGAGESDAVAGIKPSSEGLAAQELEEEQLQCASADSQPPAWDWTAVLVGHAGAASRVRCSATALLFCRSSHSSARGAWILERPLSRHRLSFALLFSLSIVCPMHRRPLTQGEDISTATRLWGARQGARRAARTAACLGARRLTMQPPPLLWMRQISKGTIWF